MVRKKLFLAGVLLGGIIIMGCELRASDKSTGDESIKVHPLTSIQSIYSLAESTKSGSITDIDFVIKYVDATIAYYKELSETPKEIQIDLEIWKRAKITESLYRISQCFSDLEVSPYCFQKISDLYSSPDDAKRKNFKLAELLLISQCSEYIFDISNPGVFKCKLKLESDKVLVGTAINKLCLTTNGDINASKQLLKCLSGIQEFKRFIPFNYKLD